MWGLVWTLVLCTDDVDEELADPQLLEAASKQLAGYTHFPLPSHAEFGIPLTF